MKKHLRIIPLSPREEQGWRGFVSSKLLVKLVILLVLITCFALELFFLPNPLVLTHKITVNPIELTKTTQASLPLPINQETTAWVATLSARQRVGQLFLTSPSGLILTEDEKEWLKTGEVGGFVLLGKNVKDEKQIQALITDIQNAATSSGIKPFIAVDQEGGRVSRMSWIDMTSQGEITSPSQAFAIALNRGQQLKNLGITMNLAPVVETGRIAGAYISTEKRDFATDSARLASMMAAGYLQAGIIPVVKHFPGGLGRVAADPHRVLPEVDISQEDLMDDLNGFQQVINYGVPALMVTHLVYPAFDSRPVAESAYFMNDLLRGKMHFEGLVMVDDLSMGAVGSDSLTNTSIIPSLAVGGDMFIITNQTQFQEVMAEMTNVLATDSWQLQTAIDRSIQRVMQVKGKWLQK